MNTLSPENFALLCFAQLMNNDEGITTKAPSYFLEKRDLLDRGYEAFGALDITNMWEVVKWHHKWGVTLPEQIAKAWEENRESAQDLKTMEV